MSFGALSANAASPLSEASRDSAMGWNPLSSLRLRLNLSERDPASDPLDCDSCSAKTPGRPERSAALDLLVTRFAKFDALFESLIDNASHHEGAYSVRFKFYL
jgi:hypothetical protein